MWRVVFLYQEGERSLLPETGDFRLRRLCKQTSLAPHRLLPPAQSLLPCQFLTDILFLCLKLWNLPALVPSSAFILLWRLPCTVKVQWNVYAFLLQSVFVTSIFRPNPKRVKENLLLPGQCTARWSSTLGEVRKLGCSPFPAHGCVCILGSSPFPTL